MTRGGRICLFSNLRSSRLAAVCCVGHNPKDYFGIYDVVRFDTFWLDKATDGLV
jgi:hypothetical protein